jgi:hypothetical protein
VWQKLYAHIFIFRYSDKTYIFWTPQILRREKEKAGLVVGRKKEFIVLTLSYGQDYPKEVRSSPKNGI